MEEFVVVGAIAALNESVLLRGGPADESVGEAELPGFLLKGSHSLRVRGEPHGEAHGVVGHGQKERG